MTEKLTIQDLEEAARAITSMISKAENVITKFREGSPQHSLQRNRLAALKTALRLIHRELSGTCEGLPPADELQQARAPIASLISKSEKTKQKLTTGTWQHTMLEANLRGLYIARVCWTERNSQKARQVPGPCQLFAPFLQ
ncbi:hypothetical protein [Candidatus Darwinibacter acetoxidans]|jgi:hypothetical protein